MIDPLLLKKMIDTLIAYTYCMLCKYCSWYITYANSTDLFIFCFTEVGKGYITPWDLERMATINDFIWTDSEISKMIRCFDSDGDGKVCLRFPLKFKYQCFYLKPN